jgi:hypothetical protein
MMPVAGIILPGGLQARARLWIWIDLVALRCL